MFNFGDVSLLRASSRFDASGRPLAQADRHLSEIRQTEAAYRQNRRARRRDAIAGILKAFGYERPAKVSRRRSATLRDAR